MIRSDPRLRSGADIAAELVAADERYIRANFVPLDALAAERLGTVRALIADGFLPEPTYRLSDGTDMVPAGHLELLDEAGTGDGIEDRFTARYRAAGGPDAASAYRDWLTGAYGMCVRNPTPERIAAKDSGGDAIEELLRRPEPDDSAWIDRLRRLVTRSTSS